jgi:hypothetical protein
MKFYYDCLKTIINNNFNVIKEMDVYNNNPSYMILFSKHNPLFIRTYHLYNMEKMAEFEIIPPNPTSKLNYKIIGNCLVTSHQYSEKKYKLY